MGQTNKSCAPKRKSTAKPKPSGKRVGKSKACKANNQLNRRVKK